MHEFYGELDGHELAMLELYRDAAGPTPEVEDRLLTRIQAQVAIEEDLAGDDRSLLGSDPIAATQARTQVRPLTAIAIAIVAFAAGVALTCGLRGQVAQLHADAHAPSVSPMTADDAPMQELAPAPSDVEACGATVIEKRVEVPVRIEVPADEDEHVEGDRGGRTSSSTAAPLGGDERDVPEGDDAAGIDQRHAVAMAPWSPARGDDRNDDGEPRRGSGARRPGRGGGSPWGGAMGGTTGSPRPSGGSQGGGGSSPGPSTNNNDGGSGSGTPGGGNRPGHDDGGHEPGNTPSDGGNGDNERPGEPDPGDPPPPPSNPDPEDPRDPDGDEPPPGEDPANDGQADEDPCLADLSVCYEQLYPWCEEDPVGCAQMQSECDLMYQTCAYPDAMMQCDQQFGDCFAQVDAVCLPEEQPVEDSEQCGQLYDQCAFEYESCLGMFGDDEGEGGGESGGEIELECDELEQNCW